MDETVTHVFRPTIRMQRSRDGWTVELELDGGAEGAYEHTLDATPGHVEQYEGGPEADRAARDLDAWLAEHAETLLSIPAADNLNRPASIARILA